MTCPVYLSRRQCDIVLSEIFATLSNPSHDKVYSKLLYMVKIVSEVGGFFRVLLFPPPIKLNATIDTLLKVALITITLTIVYA